MFWMIQLLVNCGITSYSCYPSVIELAAPAPGWTHVWTAVIVINLVMLALAIVATGLSYRNWRILSGEHPDLRDDLVEAAEGRARFVALCGALTGLGFIGGIVFDLISVLGAPICNLG